MGIGQFSLFESTGTVGIIHSPAKLQSIQVINIYVDKIKKALCINKGPLTIACPITLFIQYCSQAGLPNENFTKPWNLIRMNKLLQTGN